MWAMVGFLWHRLILAKEGGFLHPLKRVEEAAKKMMKQILEEIHPEN
jgi:hypothetical protein